jgi:hypothetical protein
LKRKGDGRGVEVFFGVGGRGKAMGEKVEVSVGAGGRRRRRERRTGSFGEIIVCG